MDEWGTLVLRFRDLPLKFLANPAAKEGHLDLKPAELRCTIIGEPHFHPT